MDTIDLKENYPFLQGGRLVPFCVSEVNDGNPPWKRPAVIVVPGGGYGYTSNREAEPVAARFLAHGFQTFILRYVCARDGKEYRYPEQLHEIAAAVDYLKKHAADYHLEKDEIFAVGFSAGGHLIGDLSMEAAKVSKEFGLDCTLKAIGLGYSVTDYFTGGASLTWTNLFQGYSDEEKHKLYEELSLSKRVTENNFPTYMFITAKDHLVPPETSLDYVRALMKHGVPCEFHLYPFGLHGISTGDLEVSGEDYYHDPTGTAKDWIKECVAFFRCFSKIKY